MKKRNILYIIISIICIVSIIIAVYYQVFKPNRSNQISNQQVQPTTVKENKLDLEKIKENFNMLFTNSFDDQGYDITSLKKINGLEDKNVIYSAYSIKEENEKYNINLNIPVFNVDSEEAAKINAVTQKVFADKANDIITKSESYTVYKIDYVAYLNENILSLVIKANLKEKDHAERLIVKTFNYDIDTGKTITLNELLNSYGIELKEVNKKIEEVITEANKQADAVSSAIGKSVYKRDINNAMYVTDNAGYFFVGLDGEVYILYPYGNSNYTSEIDIVVL